MQTQELHRGRPVDHIQLVVKDLQASHAFEAVHHGDAWRSAPSVRITF